MRERKNCNNNVLLTHIVRTPRIITIDWVCVLSIFCTGTTKVVLRLYINKYIRGEYQLTASAKRRSLRSVPSAVTATTTATKAAFASRSVPARSRLAFASRFRGLLQSIRNDIGAQIQILSQILNAFVRQVVIIILPREDLFHVFSRFERLHQFDHL